MSSLRLSEQDIPGEQQLEGMIVQHLNETLRRTKSPELNNLAEVLGSPERTVLATVREFDVYNRDPSTNEYLGIWDRPAGTTPQWSSRRSPKAIAYMKRSPLAAKLILDLCRHGVAVLVVGGVPGLLTKNEVMHPLLTFQSDLANLDAAAQHCDLFLNNGNHGSTLRMAANGVPVVAIPLYIEHELTALRLNEYGLGARWRDDPKFSTQSMLDRLLGAKCQASIQQFAGRYGEALQNSEQRAYERISSLLT